MGFQNQWPDVTLSDFEGQNQGDLSFESLLHSNDAR